MSTVTAPQSFPVVPTTVEICTSRKRHSFCDLTGSVLFFLGSPLSNVASTIADANYLGYAIEDAGRTYTKAMEIFSELTKKNINTDTLYNLGRSFTVHIGNFVSSTSDAWKFLVTCRLATAWSGLAIAGGVLGIYSKSVESYDIYNQTIEPLELPEQTEDQNDEVWVRNGQIISEHHRFAQLAFKITIIVIKVMSLASLLYAVSISATAFTIVGTIISLSDIATAYIEKYADSQLKRNIA